MLIIFSHFTKTASVKQFSMFSLQTWWNNCYRVMVVSERVQILWRCWPLTHTGNQRSAFMHVGSLSCCWMKLLHSCTYSWDGSVLLLFIFYAVCWSHFLDMVDSWSLLSKIARVRTLRRLSFKVQLGPPTLLSVESIVMFTTTLSWRYLATFRFSVVSNTIYKQTQGQFLQQGNSPHEHLTGSVFYSVHIADVFVYMYICGYTI